MQEKRQILKSYKDNGMQQKDQNFSHPVSLRFWEIDLCFKCPVVGICLTLSEQKHLLKKAGVSIKKKSSFEIHEMLVASSKNENRLSAEVDNLLNRKFGSEIALLHWFGQEEVMRHWRACFKAGDYKGALWAIITRPRLSIECRRDIFGTVHMTMHWSAEQSLKLNQKLAGLQKKLSVMQQSNKEAVRIRRGLRKKNEQLRRKQIEVMTRLAFEESEKVKMEKELAGLKSRYRLAELQQENGRLKEELDTLFEKVKTMNSEMTFLRKRNMHLLERLELQRKSSIYLKKETQEIIGKVLDLNSCDASCPSFDLCKKRVLIVGGITRMESLYRQAVEERGGIFEYHDGYMKKGVKKLENSLRRSDMVLCPVNCNSHAACSIVKNLGKKHNKPVYMLTNSSLSAVSQVIKEDINDKSEEAKNPKKAMVTAISTA